MNKSLIEAAISLVAPLECVVCAHPGESLCSACGEDTLTEVPSRCFRCLKRTSDYRTCSICWRTAPLRHVWVSSEYNDGVSKIISSYKFHRNRALARPLAKLMAESLPYHKQPLVIVPVPTATARVRQRGYDHTLILSQALAQEVGWPVRAHLRRVGQARQVGARRQSRFEQLKGVFRPVKLELLKDKNILLVDDVVTTGATLSEAARSLKNAGAKSISAVVVAHKS